jgi:hypothetical protein
MGGGLTKKKVEVEINEIIIIRRPPLTTAVEVLGSAEARARIVESLEQAPPGEVNRWQKLLLLINRSDIPSDEQPDPLQINIDIAQLKIILKTEYDDTTFAISDGILLMREHFPILYKDHSLPKAKRLSQSDRDQRHLNSDIWAYGELENEVFATIYEKVTKSYGLKKGGVFYDLGSGVGQLVYTAAFIGNFSECNGFEYITPLLETGERKLKKWNKMKKKFSSQIINTKLNWYCDDFTVNDFWTENASFIILHWTAFTKVEVGIVSDLMKYCAEGTMVVTFTHQLTCSGFDLLIKDTCRVSWGEAEFFVYEKITPAVYKAAKDKLKL